MDKPWILFSLDAFANSMITHGIQFGEVEKDNVIEGLEEARKVMNLIFDSLEESATQGEMGPKELESLQKFIVFVVGGMGIMTHEDYPMEVSVI